MRTVEKGIAPNVYQKYGDAKHDLAGRIGYYCSYCEMSVHNMLEVEHVHPRDNGGADLDWDNFLLSCKYCNTIKSSRNLNRIGYLWPDQDNTDLAFEYNSANEVSVKTGLTGTLAQAAENTIHLMGLDRLPEHAALTPADTRWRSRQEAWNKANQSLNNWRRAPIPEMAAQIALSALESHYSVWMTVFEGIPDVLAAIDLEYERFGLFKDRDAAGLRVIRTNGQI